VPCPATPLRVVVAARKHAIGRDFGGPRRHFRSPSDPSGRSTSAAFVHVCKRSRAVSVAELLREVTLRADLAHDVQLRFQPIDPVLFFAED
jgi:hypothetical protein